MYFGQKKEQHYITVGTVSMFIEPIAMCHLFLSPSVCLRLSHTYISMEQIEQILLNRCYLDSCPEPSSYASDVHVRQRNEKHDEDVMLLFPSERATTSQPFHHEWNADRGGCRPLQRCMLRKATRLYFSFLMTKAIG